MNKLEEKVIIHGQQIQNLQKEADEQKTLRNDIGTIKTDLKLAIQQMESQTTERGLMWKRIVRAERLLVVVLVGLATTDVLVVGILYILDLKLGGYLPW